MVPPTGWHPNWDDYWGYVRKHTTTQRATMELLQKSAEVLLRDSIDFNTVVRRLLFDDTTQ